MRLDHVALTVADRERSATFYARHLGFGTVVHEDEHLLILADASGGLLALSTGDGAGAAAHEPLRRAGALGAMPSAPLASASRPPACPRRNGRTTARFVRVQVLDPDGYRVDVYAT